MIFTNYKKRAIELNFLVCKLRPLHSIASKDAAIEYINQIAFECQLEMSDHVRYITVRRAASLVEDIEITVDLEAGPWQGSGTFTDDDGAIRWTQEFEVEIDAVGYGDFSDFFMRVNKYQDVITTEGIVRGRKTMPLIKKYRELFKGSSVYICDF